MTSEERAAEIARKLPPIMRGLGLESMIAGIPRRGTACPGGYFCDDVWRDCERRSTGRTIRCSDCGGE